MSVSGVNTVQTALLQSAKNSSNSSSPASNSFSSLLSDAFQGVQNQGAYDEKYDMYAELLKDSSGSSKELLTTLLSVGSGISPMMYISLCNALAGNTSISCTGVASKAMVNVEAGLGDVTQDPWKPTDPAIVSDVYNRSAELYRNVIGQFNVASNPRYSTSRGGTYCNIFVWDVTSAMGAEIPHYYNASTGKPMEYGDNGANQMTANRMHSWLHEHGEEYGWYEVSAREAQNIANQGRPVVTALYRNGAHGHVQAVCPSKDGKYNEEKGVTIAQAGRNLTSYTYISNIYNASLSKVSYFAHM